MFNKFFLLCCFALLSLTGCSGNVQLSGKVTFSDDGSPLTCGRVCFLADDLQAFGDLKADGTFVVGTSSPNDGLPLGSYKVFITGAVRTVESVERTQKLGDETLKIVDEVTESLIDKKFTSPSTSGLTLEVTPSTRHYPIRVERYKRI